jgi:hypothetical protein
VVPEEFVGRSIDEHDTVIGRADLIGPPLRVHVDAAILCERGLQTDADRERVIDGLATSGSASDARALGKIVQRLPERWFVVRNAHAQGAPLLVQPRWAMSLMRGLLRITGAVWPPGTPLARCVGA